MRIGILSDKFSYFSSLQKILRHNGLDGEYRYFDSPAAFFKLAEIRFFDLVILDGNVGGIEGPLISGKIRENSPETIIVFVTDRTGMVFRAVGVNVLAFVSKQNLKRNARELVRRIRKEIMLRQNLVFMTADSRYVRISPSRLLYAVLVQRHVVLYLEEQRVVLKKMSMSKVFSMFPKKSCVYVSRCCFVNKAKITEIHHRTLIIEGIPQPFEISRGRLEEVIEEFTESDDQE